MKKLAYINGIVGILFITCGILLQTVTPVKEISGRMIENKATTVKLVKQNDYFRNYDFQYVQNTTNTTPKNYQDILNLVYSIANNGYDTFTFYCDKNYKECSEDVKKITLNPETITTINNYLHSYNSFEEIKIGINKAGEVKIDFKKKYSDELITKINEKIDEIYAASYIDPNGDLVDSIKKFHDYIIEHSIYDTDRAENDIKTHLSNIAYGPLLEGYSICGGYTDAMQLFLEKLNIKNFKIASEKHIWNAIYLDGNWYHIDLTWDDPVTPNNINVLKHDYFLINTDTIRNLDLTEHDFVLSNYQEMQN